MNSLNISIAPCKTRSPTSAAPRSAPSTRSGFVDGNRTMRSRSRRTERQIRSVLLRSRRLVAVPKHDLVRLRHRVRPYIEERPDARADEENAAAVFIRLDTVVDPCRRKDRFEPQSVLQFPRNVDEDRLVAVKKRSILLHVGALLSVGGFPVGAAHRNPSGP